MHPAPSVIIFTVLSGLGFGFLAFLGFGFLTASGWSAFLLWGLGYALAVGGLVASTFHLGNPQRALRAFTQWRSSWLSREAWCSVAALVLLAPMALSDWLGLGFSRLSGIPGGVMCLVTVYATSMIYAQIRAVPRWNHWTTPLVFLAFSLTGGAIMVGAGLLPVALCAVLLVALVANYTFGDRQFALRGATMGTATGLGAGDAMKVFEQPHTGDNYLLREMIFVVGRRHADKLRLIAIVLAVVVPGVLMALVQGSVVVVVAAVLVHLAGAFAARWLFFAQAEHVVGLYYGKR